VFSDSSSIYGNGSTNGYYDFFEELMTLLLLFFFSTSPFSDYSSLVKSTAATA
jgi:hypothetical protein